MWPNPRGSSRPGKKSSTVEAWKNTSRMEETRRQRRRRKRECECQPRDGATATLRSPRRRRSPLRWPPSHRLWEEGSLQGYCFFAASANVDP
ncbi:hypothetical protein DAI22_02g036200 [Oryza sativa Japonica Group]|nr:hypothetical protein DAI22_02g036200 [Oryza sativa Japonica Group]